MVQIGQFDMFVMNQSFKTRYVKGLKKKEGKNNCK